MGKSTKNNILTYGVSIGKIEIDPRFKDKNLLVYPIISNGHYQYTVWYAFKEKGVYSISFDDVAPIYQKNAGSKTCEGAYFNVGVKNIDPHKELWLRDIPDYVPLTNVEKYHLYCFEVY